MIVRLRTKVGMWRHEAEPHTKLCELVAKVEHEKGVKIVQVSRTPDMATPLLDKGTSTLEELSIKHGDILHVDASGATSASAGTAGLVGAGPKAIDANGNLVAATSGPKAAFRPGLQALRTQKLHWTLTDMVEFDSKYTFEVKGEQLSFCASASLDATSCNSFQLYLQNFGFGVARCAYLYGKFMDSREIPGSVEHKEAKEAADATLPPKPSGSKKQMKLADLEAMNKEAQAPKKGVMVHAIYEPLQQEGAKEFQLLEDPREEKIDILARALGLEKVGFMFSHPPGREGYTLSTHEIINAGEQALEATDGKFDSPFVVVKVTSEEGNASFDAFSLTPQCLEMVAEDALLHMADNPGHAAINETFTLIVEKKETHVVDNDFFIKRVPILSHTSPFRANFARLNRDHDTPPTQEAFATALKTLGPNPADAAIAKAIADFHMLAFLTSLFDSEEELAAIGRFVASHVVPGAEPLPLGEGFKLVILGFAGVDS